MLFFFGIRLVCLQLVVVSVHFAAQVLKLLAALYAEDDASDLAPVARRLH